MSFEDKFKQQIDSFQRYGTYNYKYDSVGNLIFNSSSNDFSQVFLGLPLMNYVYDAGKILAFYDPTFTEFIPTTNTIAEPSEEIQALQDELESANQQNEILSNKLNEMIAASEMKSSDADKEAMKQVILELRIELGQGRIESDFSKDFPYTPIRKETNIKEETS